MDRIKQASGPEKPCPICGKACDALYAPFCSKRCADVDLGRWFGEAYRIPVQPERGDEFDEFDDFDEFDALDALEEGLARPPREH